ncbi:hypothetical protein SAMN04487941_2478 [Pontibacter akesuensis]|uniref:Uncharacterized protein n=1 Tax=Pontibacter akesuensis TaxID=388950 RepID=A0A1I7J4E1_9BACT|nr:hypothetical protein SAMN04487941_2478 [Pontibacter akesuensis]
MRWRSYLIGFVVRSIFLPFYNFDTPKLTLDSNIVSKTIKLFGRSVNFIKRDFNSSTTV